MKITIYAVEDDDSIRDLYKYTFEPLGYECISYETAEEMIERFKEQPCNIILMDVMLPGMDGFTAVRKVREISQNTPIIMVSARTDEINKVRGLDAGADDYISKPFGVLELVARVKANLRKQISQYDDNKTYTAGEIVLKNSEHVVKVNNKEMPLTLKEYNLLKLLMSRADTVVSRETILNEVWGYDYYGETRTLDMHIKSLRYKISEFTPKHYIETVRGIGYKLNSNEDRN